jgi:hypothetical protein
MDRATEERWHAALDAKGAAQILTELELTRGRPADPVFDVGDRPPYPTRAYCAQWCRNGGRPSARGAGAKVMGGMLILLLFASVVKTIDSWPAASHGVGYAYGGAALPVGPAPASDDGLANVAVVSTADPHSILPSCTWVSSAGDAATVDTLPSCARLGTRSDENSAAHG